MREKRVTQKSQYPDRNNRRNNFKKLLINNIYRYFLDHGKIPHQHDSP